MIFDEHSELRRILMPGGFTLSDRRRYQEPAVRHAALYYEVARCVAEGRLESSLRPLDDSLVMLGALDAVHPSALAPSC